MPDLPADATPPPTPTHFRLKNCTGVHVPLIHERHHCGRVAPEAAEPMILPPFAELVGVKVIQDIHRNRIILFNGDDIFTLTYHPKLVVEAFGPEGRPVPTYGADLDLPPLVPSHPGDGKPCELCKGPCDVPF